jgi:hypothetical protein
MARIRFGVRWLIIAVAALAVPVVFFRPDSHHDPEILSVTYCAIIVAGFVQLLIYAMSLVSLPIAGDSIPETPESSQPEFGLGPEQQVGGGAGHEWLG